MIQNINKEVVKEMFYKNISPEKIAKELNCSPSGVRYVLKKLNLNREYKLCENKPIILSTFQKNVLIGTLLGDSYISLKRKNPIIKIEHSIKQKQLVEWKHTVFKNMTNSITKCVRNPDKRTGNIYSSYSFYLKANPEFMDIYNSLYKTGIKDISIESLQYYNEISLAVHIMDDGSRNGKQIILNTQSFSINGISILQSHLKENFNINTHIRYNRNQPILCINSTSLDLVKNYTSKYIIENMKYKVS